MSELPKLKVICLTALTNEETYIDDDKLFFGKYNEEEDNIIPPISQAVIETVTNKKRKKDKIKNCNRHTMKVFRLNGYENWLEDKFKE